MNYQDEDQILRDKLWKNRRKICFACIAYTLYLILILIIPYFIYAGTLKTYTFGKLGFFGSIFGIILATSSLIESSPIYKMTKENIPLVALFACLFILLPLYGHLYEIQQIEFASSISILANISSLCLGILTGIMFFRFSRKESILLGIPIFIGIFGIFVGGLFGGILFMLISLFIS